MQHSRDFFSLSSKASGAAAVGGGERSKWTLGVIQTGNFQLSDRHEVGAQVSGRGLCCRIYVFKTYARLAGFPAARRPGRGGYHTRSTKQQMMCGVNSMETHPPWERRTAASSVSLSSPAFEALEYVPLLPPPLQETEKMLLLHLLLTVPRS